MQFSSSDPSRQSGWPLHCSTVLIHWPSAHATSRTEHVRGAGVSAGLGVATTRAHRSAGRSPAAHHGRLRGRHTQQARTSQQFRKRKLQLQFSFFFSHVGGKNYHEIIPPGNIIYRMEFCEQ